MLQSNEKENRSDLKRFASWVVTHNELVIVGITFVALSEFSEFINSISTRNNTQIQETSSAETNFSYIIIDTLEFSKGNDKTTKSVFYRYFLQTFQSLMI